jgi:hypothetical protein
MERARTIESAEPNTDNLRNYLLYLLEQYENLETQQRRERQDMGARRGTASSGESSATPKAPTGEVSVHFVQKPVKLLGVYLANPTGEPPLLERLEIKRAVVYPPLSLSPLQVSDKVSDEVVEAGTTVYSRAWGGV